MRSRRAVSTVHAGILGLHFSHDKLHQLLFWLIFGVVLHPLFWLFHGLAWIERNVAMKIQQTFTKASIKN